MNIAFTTVLIVAFLVPGALYRKFYFIGQFSKQYLRSSYLELVLAGFLPSIIFHVLCICFVASIGHPVDFSVVGQLLMSRDFPDRAFQNIQSNLVNIAGYGILICVFASICGYIFHKIIRSLGFDQRFKMFRFENFWHYILYGEFINFPRASIELVADTTKDIEFIQIDAVVEIREESLLYEGILVDYELTRDGGLECIYLKGGRRRPMNKDRHEPRYIPKHYEIPGHVVIIPYKHIKNLNFSYFKVVLDNDPKTREVEFRPELVR